MSEYDYSQLPVIDEQGAPLGMVTSESILRALNNFKVTLDALQVSHAVTRVRAFRADEDLFELLDDLRDEYAVVIVDNDGHLVGIVTSYDTTEYFRRRAEDMMLVEDIEGMVKDRILSAFSDDQGRVDAQALEQAISDVTDSKQAQFKKFQHALRQYLKLAGDNSQNISEQAAEEAFTQLFGKDTTRAFDQLTLYDYIELLLHKKQWTRLAPVFALEPQAVRTLLHGVRSSRNSLAHFHGELSAPQRDQLRFAAGWLKRAQLPIPEPPAREVTELDLKQIEELEAQRATSDGASNTEELVRSSESRYGRLALFLQEQPAGWDTLQLTFNDIEAIIDGELPASAREHRAWWANDSTHAQALQWLRVGWRTATINMTDGKVIFTRTPDGQ
jgi:CBS domain-containing protein